MPGTELFTIIAMVEARDRAGVVLSRLEKAFTSLSESATRTAETMRTAGESMDSSMMRSASGADELELGISRLAAARARLSAASREQAAAENDLMAAQQRAASYAVTGAQAEEELVAALTRLDEAASVAARAEAYLAEAQAAQSEAAIRASGANDVAAAAAARNAKANESGLLAVNKWGKAAMIGAGAAAFIGFEAIKTASKFDTLTTRLVTSANESTKNLAMIRQGILDVSVQTGTSAQQISDGMYVVESAGYHAADGLKVLKAATEGAQMEGAQFKDVANGVTDILKDYHLKASDAARVTSQLVAGVAAGKSNFQTFSKALANIIPIGSAAGLKLQDLTGVLATMTSHGYTAQRASFNVANAIRSLEKPIPSMVTEFKKLGITSDEVAQHLSKQGLAGTMEFLSQTAQKAGKIGTPAYTSALASLMGTATGLNVALSTTGKNFGDTQAAMKSIAGATAQADGNVRGYSEVQKTLSYQMGVFKASVFAAGTAIGNALIPTLVSLMGAVNGVLTPMANFAEKHKTMMGIIIGVVVAFGTLVAVLKVASMVMAAFDMVADANPFVLLGLAIVALVGFIIYAWNHFKTFRDVVTSVLSAVVTAAMAVWHGMEAAWRGIVVALQWLWGVMKSVWGYIKEGALDLWHFLVAAWDAIASVTTSVWNSIVGFFKKWWPLLLVIFLPFVALIIAIWNHFHKQIESTAKAVWGGIKTFLGAIWSGIKWLAQSTWGLIRTAIIQPMEAMWRSLVVIWNAIKPYLLSAWHTIMGYAQVAWNAIKNYVINPVNELWSYLTSKFDSIKNYISSKLSEAMSEVESIAKGFLSVGEDIVNGIISGVESSAGALFSSLKSLASDALSAAKSFLGIGSPSKLFSDEVGKWIPHGVAVGVKRYASVAAQAVRGMTSGLTGTLPAGGGVAMVGGLTGGMGGLVGGGAGGGNIIIDVHDNHIMNDRDIDRLVEKVGRRVATTILPQGGVRIRM